MMSSKYRSYLDRDEICKSPSQLEVEKQLNKVVQLSDFYFDDELAPAIVCKECTTKETEISELYDTLYIEKLKNKLEETEKQLKDKDVIIDNLNSIIVNMTKIAENNDDQHTNIVKGYDSKEKQTAGDTDAKMKVKDEMIDTLNRKISNMNDTIKAKDVRFINMSNSNNEKEKQIVELEEHIQRAITNRIKALDSSKEWQEWAANVMKEQHQKEINDLKESYQKKINDLEKEALLNRERILELSNQLLEIAGKRDEVIGPLYKSVKDLIKINNEHVLRNQYSKY